LPQNETLEFKSNKICVRSLWRKLQNLWIKEPNKLSDLPCSWLVRSKLSSCQFFPTWFIHLMKSQSTFPKINFLYWQTVKLAGFFCLFVCLLSFFFKPFCSGYFWDRVLHSCPGWPRLQLSYLCFPNSWDDRWPTSQPAFIGWYGDLANCFLRLSSNFDPPYLCLLSHCAYLILKLIQRGGRPRILKENTVGDWHCPASRLSISQ
jgi:hypothetical protein